MEKKIIKQFESVIFLCDICNLEVVQDGKNITLLKGPRNVEGYYYHMHTLCLIEHLLKTFIPHI